MLAGLKRKEEKWTIMKGLFSRKRKKLEQVADEVNVKIFGKDLFRFAVKKEK